MADLAVKVFANEAKVQSELCALIEKVAREAITKRGKFVIGVSGGSLAKILCNGLVNIETDWSKWHLLFCDERVVPFSDGESTYKYYKENLISKNSQLSDGQVLKINPNLLVSECAADYARQLLALFPSTKPPSIPKLDIALLGMGPDGHTCSLFPGHALLEERELLVASIANSPKPPPQRVTLTYPVLNNSHYVVFVATGQGKAGMLKRVIDESLEESVSTSAKLPSARVSVGPGEGQLLWYVDRDAARLLPQTHANITYLLPMD